MEIEVDGGPFAHVMYASAGFRAARAATDRYSVILHAPETAGGRAAREFASEMDHSYRDRSKAYAPLGRSQLVVTRSHDGSEVALSISDNKPWIGLFSSPRDGRVVEVFEETRLRPEDLRWWGYDEDGAPLSSASHRAPMALTGRPTGRSGPAAPAVAEGSESAGAAADGGRRHP